MAVGDTVYRISPRAGMALPEAVAQASVGDTSELTDQEEESMNSDLDSLFANSTDGLDPAELSSIRELASIARPHSSHWGDEFYKEGTTGVGGVSGYTMKNVTGCWDPTLDRLASASNGPNSHSGWGAGLSDQYSLAPISSGGKFYGGGTGSAYASRRHHSASHVVSQYCPPGGGGPGTSVPEPASLSLVVLGAGALLRRRRAK